MHDARMTADNGTHDLAIVPFTAAAKATTYSFAFSGVNGTAILNGIVTTDGSGVLSSGSTTGVQRPLRR